MKLIELQAHGRTYFINPAQITHVEGSETGSVYITVTLAEVNEGKAVSLVFRGEEALRLFYALRTI